MLKFNIYSAHLKYLLFLKEKCHRYTCVPHPEPSSLLPPHSMPLGRPSAPAPSIQYRASTWTGISFHTWYFTCFNAILKIHAFPPPLMYFFNSSFNSSDSFMELIQSFPPIPFYFFCSFFCIPYYFFCRNSLYYFFPISLTISSFFPPQTHMHLCIPEVCYNFTIPRR